ncbi:MAG: HAMP domain-containing histidine kinase [Saccharofermentans sp.]|nr:HAMP domain-containing histidine kinase [Saccharofermentans sp.]
MRKYIFPILVVVTFIVEGALCGMFYSKMVFSNNDTVQINTCLKSVETSYGNDQLYDKTLDYVVLDNNGKVVFRTKEGLSESVNEAVTNNDTILDINLKGELGKIIFHNRTADNIRYYRTRIVISLVCCSAVQMILIFAFYIYLRKTVTKPFEDLNDFAVRVAGGNLDVPLKMDKGNVFGSFSEAFDLMRTELKKARVAEKKANDDKKEMVAKLSHDIKTPVASIKSTSEIGYELAKDEKSQEYFNLINTKTDQIKVLVDNLFESSVNDATEIKVSPSEYNSTVIKELVKKSDYLNRAEDFVMPSCMVYIDKLRMQQSLDNIFMNSYKYADTKITVTADEGEDKDYLILTIRDYGDGVPESELPLLKEKYNRGSNCKDKDGAGLGLYLTDYFITNMNGRMRLENAEPGFAVILYVRSI